MITTKITLPYGLWPSPVTPSMVGQNIRLEDVQWDSDDRTLVWLERRSGKGVLVVRPDEGVRRDLTDDQSVRGGVGYGGGDFSISQGNVFFVEADGRLYRRSLGYDRPHPITPPFGRAASPVLSPDGSWIVYVFSDGTTDLLALVDVKGKEWPVQLVRGADFYMQPSWHPGAEQLAWIEWNHPNMPWDGTRLKLGRIGGEPLPRLQEETLIAGDENTPVCQPLFSPDGRWLSYVISNGEWDDLVLYNLETSERRVLVHGEGFMLALPAWGQGGRSYGWHHSGRKLYTIRNHAGRSALWEVDLEGHSREIDISPYTWITQLAVSSIDDQVAFLASAPHIPDRIVCWNGKRLYVECHSESEGVPPDMLPVAQPIHWLDENGSPVYGTYYPPSNSSYTSSGLPPAVVHVHGGPTSAVPEAYSAERVFFTTRGYAWLDLNYRGSTSFGRTYQKAMRQRWGDVDTRDAEGAAKALVDQKLADGKKLIILGGSAGGYLVLNALVHYPGLYKAGICLYGVSSLFTLAMDTHKFEAHYTDSMVGFLPEAAERYHAWSPIFHADKIRDPLAVFQGGMDKVVLPVQSEEIVTALQKHGVPYIYKLYENEGHGFRHTENIIDYLEQTERFLKQYVLFSI